jgi:hypothetical protein
VQPSGPVEDMAGNEMSALIYEPRPSFVTATKLQLKHLKA